MSIHILVYYTCLWVIRSDFKYATFAHACKANVSLKWKNRKWHECKLNITMIITIVVLSFAFISDNILNNCVSKTVWTWISTQISTRF